MIRKVRKNMGKIAEKKPSDIKDGTFLGGMYNKMGTCRFCGQMKAMTYISDSVSQDDVDRDVTMTCTCKEAHDYSMLQQAAAKAKTNLRTLNEQMQTRFSESVEKQCDGIIDLIAAGELKNVSFKADQKTISIKKKGDSINVSIHKAIKWDIDS